MQTLKVIAKLLLSIVLSIGVGSDLCANAAESPVPKPNIIFILMDDLGWKDLGCYGSTFYQTPNIDKLAAQGMRFTDAYAAAPICSPTRASLLTGKAPARLHLTDWLPGRPDRPDQRLSRPPIEAQLPLSERTLPKILHNAGYISAAIGKWHLGGKGFSPQDQGFDVNIAGSQSGSPPGYFYPYSFGKEAVPGLEKGEKGEYLTDRLTTEAEKFIEQNKEKPFFLYLAHYAVHIPLGAKEAMIAPYQQAAKGTQTNALYAAMVQSMDESVGRIVQKVESLNLARRTIIIFTSDNGGLSVLEGPKTPATSNLPLKEGKGYLYEGGIRVPLIVRWPGVVPAKSTASAPVISMDAFPTLLEFAGISGAAFPTNDGLSLVPLLKGAATTLARPGLFWHYPHYSNQGGKPGGAARIGDFKLIEHYEDGRWDLFNLKDDLGETNNLARTLPKKASELQAKLDAWRRATKAQMMLPNTNYNPASVANAVTVTNSKATVVVQSADGSVFLHSRDVIIHGTTVRYEPQPQKNTIGYWTRKEDWVSWEFEVTRPGEFEVEILQGCGKGSGGSEVDFSVGSQTLPVTVQETGGFQNFVARKIGTLKLEAAGRYTLSVKPRTKPGVAVMDLRSVLLHLTNSRL